MKGYLSHHPSFAANPLGDWEELIGQPLASYCQPKSLKNKLLVIVAYDSVWKHHLELNKEALLQKINLKRPESLVEKIVIRVGALPEVLPVLNPSHREMEKIGKKRSPAKRKKKPPSRELTLEEKELLRALADPDLRVIATRLLRKIPLASE